MHQANSKLWFNRRKPKWATWYSNMKDEPEVQVSIVFIWCIGMNAKVHTIVETWRDPNIPISKILRDETTNVHSFGHWFLIIEWKSLLPIILMTSFQQNCWQEFIHYQSSVNWILTENAIACAKKMKLIVTFWPVEEYSIKLIVKSNMKQLVKWNLCLNKFN